MSHFLPRNCNFSHLSDFLLCKSHPQHHHIGCYGHLGPYAFGVSIYKPFAHISQVVPSLLLTLLCSILNKLIALTMNKFYNGVVFSLCQDQIVVTL